MSRWRKVSKIEEKTVRFLNLTKEKACIMNGGKIAELVEWATPAEPRRSTSPERTAELPLDLSEFSKRQDRYTQTTCVI